LSLFKKIFTYLLLKCGGPDLIRHLHRLINEIWEIEEMQEEWKTGLICPIFKKGDKLNCSNYRGVTLLNVAYEVFSGILQRRLSCYAEEILGKYQCGFHPGRSTIDQIFVMRQSMEKCFEHDVNLHMLFIDFQQAFDSIRRRELLNVMEGFGIPRKLVRLAGLTTTEFRSTAPFGSKTGRAFEVSTGV
jgi:sorting nexin-29